MKKFADQVAIVTGGAHGIGRATSRRFLEEGAKVLIADIDFEGAKTAAEGSGAAAGAAEAFRCDVRRHEDIAAMIQRAADVWGRLDILVNNAYDPTMGGHSGALEMSEEEWDSTMAVITKSVFLAAKYAVPQMEKGDGGKIVNTSSVHGLLTASGMLGYETGKSAVIAMTRQMATEFGPMGIRVNAVCPGLILSERVEAMFDGSPSTLRFYEEHYPLRRAGRPLDVANATVFLCSEEASFITGHALVVDGGLTVQLQHDFAVQQARYLREHPETVPER